MLKKVCYNLIILILFKVGWPGVAVGLWYCNIFWIIGRLIWVRDGGFFTGWRMGILEIILHCILLVLLWRDNPTKFYSSINYVHGFDIFPVSDIDRFCRTIDNSLRDEITNLSSLPDEIKDRHADIIDDLKSFNTCNCDHMVYDIIKSSTKSITQIERYQCDNKCEPDNRTREYCTSDKECVLYPFTQCDQIYNRCERPRNDLPGRTFQKLSSRYDNPIFADLDNGALTHDLETPSSEGWKIDDYMKRRVRENGRDMPICLDPYYRKVNMTWKNNPDGEPSDNTDDPICCFPKTQDELRTENAHALEVIMSDTNILSRMDDETLIQTSLTIIDLAYMKYASKARIWAEESLKGVEEMKKLNRIAYLVLRETLTLMRVSGKTLWGVTGGTLIEILKF